MLPGEAMLKKLRKDIPQLQVLQQEKENITLTSELVERKNVQDEMKQDSTSKEPTKCDQQDGEQEMENIIRTSELFERKNVQEEMKQQTTFEEPTKCDQQDGEQEMENIIRTSELFERKNVQEEMKQQTTFEEPTKCDQQNGEQETEYITLAPKRKCVRKNKKTEQPIKSEQQQKNITLAYKPVICKYAQRNKKPTLGQQLTMQLGEEQALIADGKALEKPNDRFLSVESVAPNLILDFIHTSKNQYIQPIYAVLRKLRSHIPPVSSLKIEDFERIDEANNISVVFQLAESFVVAKHYFDENAAVVELCGDFIIHDDKFMNRLANIGRHVFFYEVPFDLAAKRDKTPVTVRVDTRFNGNNSRYIRRSCRPNCELRHCFDDNGNIRLMVVATQTLFAFREITLPFQPYDFQRELKPSTLCACGLGNICGLMCTDTAPFTPYSSTTLTVEDLPPTTPFIQSYSFAQRDLHFCGLMKLKDETDTLLKEKADRMKQPMYGVNITSDSPENKYYVSEIPETCNKLHKITTINQYISTNQTQACSSESQETFPAIEQFMFSTPPYAPFLEVQSINQDISTNQTQASSSQSQETFPAMEQFMFSTPPYAPILEVPTKVSKCTQTPLSLNSQYEFALPKPKAILPVIESENSNKTNADPSPIMPEVLAKQLGADTEPAMKLIPWSKVSGVPGSTKPIVCTAVRQFYIPMSAIRENSKKIALASQQTEASKSLPTYMARSSSNTTHSNSPSISEYLNEIPSGIPKLTEPVLSGIVRKSQIPHLMSIMSKTGLEFHPIDSMPKPSSSGHQYKPQ